MFAIIIIILFIDLLTFKGLMLLLKAKKKNLKWFVFGLHWIIPVGLFLSTFLISSKSDESHSAGSVYRYFIIAWFFLLFYIPKLIFAAFHLLEDIIKVIIFLFYSSARMFSGKKISQKGTPMSRKKFITTTGLTLASIPFLSIIYGTVWGRFNFRTISIDLGFADLPASFNGYKIVQLSDLHIGSFYGNADKIENVVETVNHLYPDLILFTGDMVNNFAEEMNDFKHILKGLKAKNGIYSILGNHDYGDYHSWPSESEKKRNFENLINNQNNIGLQVLMNESRLLKKGNEEIALIGVENWGKPPFAQYGDFKKAEKNVRDIRFKILLSHDPTHWDAQIRKNSNVQLTLSGHTHGMQFGVETGNIKWSPVQYKYPHWAGLYKEGNQFLYVNRGLGCIGYPGRVGMPPEITVIELKRVVRHY